jgi:hypothetical protein
MNITVQVLNPKKDLTAILCCDKVSLLCEQVFVGIYRTAEAKARLCGFFVTRGRLRAGIPDC